MIQDTSTHYPIIARDSIPSQEMVKLHNVVSLWYSFARMLTEISCGNPFRMRLRLIITEQDCIREFYKKI